MAEKSGTMNEESARTESPGQSGSSSTPRRRGGRKRLLWCLMPLMALALIAEIIAWVADSKDGFRERLLKAYHLMETVNQPEPPLRLTWPEGALPVRIPIDAPAPAKPYETGGRLIEDANPTAKKSVMVYSAKIPQEPAGRVFVVGGSAAYGFPYNASRSFAALLDKRLQDQTARVYNAARDGWASPEVVSVAERIIDDFSPTSLIIFVGNNEWIRWSPEKQPWISPARLATLRALSHSRALAAVEFWSLRRSVAARDEVTDQTKFTLHHEIEGAGYALAHPTHPKSFNPQQWLGTKQQFLDVFESNLQRMVRFAQRRKVQVILLTLPFNYKLSPAWKHPQPEAFDPAHAEFVRQQLHEAADLVELRQYEQALEKIQAALAKDPLPPLLNYLQGQCLEALGKPLEAEAAFARCRENMVGNLGSRLSVNERIRQVAQQTGAELLDVRKLFDDYEHARGKYFNQDLIHDDCHPTLLGHQLIANALQPLLVKKES